MKPIFTALWLVAPAFFIFTAGRLAFAAGGFCASSRMPENTAYQASQKDFELAFAKFANSPTIAKPADDTLSKLLASQSPAIVDWMRNRDFVKKTDYEVAKEWRLYYAKMFALATYPKPDAKTNQMIETLIDSTYRHTMTKARRGKLEKLFAEAKTLALRRIDGMALPDKSKTAIASRVGAITLYWMTDFKKSKFTKAPLEVISWGIAYDSVPNQINMGIEALKYPNDATIFAVFAHEIGHAFDPCRWGAFFESANPFKEVVACLRTSSSARAKVRDDSHLEEYHKTGNLSEDLYVALKTNPTCNKAQYPPLGVQADQVLEAFADWFSAEVVGLSRYATKEMRVDLCEDHKLNAGSSYPANDVRLSRIYLAQPEILKKLNLTAEEGVRYCTLVGGTE